MSEPKGPKVDMPSELLAELDESGEAKPEAAAAPASPEVAAELVERQDLHNYANENLVKELLPIVDNLERAVDHARKEEQRSDSDNLLQGVELTHRSLLQILTRLGVVEIAALGQPFDPQIHEAVRRIPSSDQPPNTVVAIYQKGYMLKDRMLRPAMVAVATEAG